MIYIDIHKQIYCWYHYFEQTVMLDQLKNKKIKSFYFTFIYS